MSAKKDRGGAAEGSSSYLEQAESIALKALDMDKITAAELPGYITAIAVALAKADRNINSLGRPETWSPSDIRPSGSWIPDDNKKRRSPGEPAVPIKNSVEDDWIICLEDGKRMKMLKRHLRVFYDMSPQEYREKWNLPEDYPMVAPVYRRLRQKLSPGTRAKKSAQEKGVGARRGPRKRKLTPGRERTGRGRAGRGKTGEEKTGEEKAGEENTDEEKIDEGQE